MCTEKFTICVATCVLALSTIGCNNRTIPDRFVPNQSKCSSFEIVNENGDAVFQFTNPELRKLERTWGSKVDYSKFSQVQIDAFNNPVMKNGTASCTFSDGLVVHCDSVRIGKIGSKLLMTFSVPESEFFFDEACPVEVFLDEVIVDDRLIELERFIEKSR